MGRCPLAPARSTSSSLSASPAPGSLPPAIRPQPPDRRRTAAAADVLATAAVRSGALHNGGDVLFNYSAALDGFAARLPEPALEALEDNPNVAYVDYAFPLAAYAGQSIEIRFLSKEDEFGYTGWAIDDVVVK